MAHKKTTALLKSEFAATLSLAEKFNIKAGARPNRQVKATLSQAIAFLAPIANDVGRKGAVIETGSSWTGPDTFLDAAGARQLARSKERTAYLTGTVDVALSQRDHASLTTIRKAFNLRSDKQAAALALRVYRSVCDGLWRGNGFLMADKSGQPVTIDTQKIEALVRRAP